MNSPSPVATAEKNFRRILGVRFFVGDAASAVELGSRGALVVVPAAPALMDLLRDPEYRRALLGADFAITDSGLLVLLWNAMKRDNIQRVSGLKYLRLLLGRPEFHKQDAALWIMPSQAAMQKNLAWLNAQGFPVRAEDCYVAPKYSAHGVIDEDLAKLVNERNPRHVIIGLGGGIQEKLGLYLKQHCQIYPAIHCIGAAIGFLSGDQVNIPAWADKFILGWLFRCASNPTRFVPRYARALRLPALLWRYRDQMPAMLAGASARSI
jgi:N-acetylglucosaminyldiphosphoundecaprenol N-acetyl-beta-D-mannosaminyltransferase